MAPDANHSLIANPQSVDAVCDGRVVAEVGVRVQRKKYQTSDTGLRWTSDSVVIVRISDEGPWPVGPSASREHPRSGVWRKGRQMLRSATEATHQNVPGLSG